MPSELYYCNDTNRVHGYSILSSFTKAQFSPNKTEFDHLYRKATSIIKTTLHFSNEKFINSPVENSYQEIGRSVVMIHYIVITRV